MDFSLTEAQEFYSLWKEAYIAVSSGQSYSINTGGSSRSLTRLNMAEIKKEMLYWQNIIKNLEKGKSGLSIKFGVPYK